MVSQNNNGLDSLLQYLTINSGYEVKETYSDDLSYGEFINSLPGYEDFRVKIPKSEISLDNEIEIPANLIHHIRDFYEIEHNCIYREHGNGTMTFIMPSGVISVVATAIKDEVRVSATNICAEYLKK